MHNTPTPVLVAGVVIIVSAMAAVVALAVTGHVETAVNLPIAVASLGPVLFLQGHTSHQVGQVNVKTDELLNGFTEAAMGRALATHDDQAAPDAASVDTELAHAIEEVAPGAVNEALRRADDQ